MSKDVKEAQRRATFNDTVIYQMRWRKKIDELVNEKRCVKPEERDEFFELFATATFGLGTEPVTFWLRSGDKLEIPNLQYFLRCMLYYDGGDVVDKKFLKHKLGLRITPERDVDIGEIWENIRDYCAGPTAEALTMSVRISKELIRDGKRVKRVSTVQNGDTNGVY